MVTVDTWHGCYRAGWQGLMTPAAFAHPAKYSRSLIQRIYQHARAQGWLHPGETVADPFGGVGLGALDALLMGCRWIGMELEPRFVQLASDNLSLWLQRYGHLATCGTAGILQGDSRQLASALAPAIACVCSSPPYNLPMSQDHNGTRGGQRGSTPSEDGAFHVYGTTPGQLEGLPPGDLAAVITSPPYANGLGKEETYADHAKREKDSHRGIMRKKGIADPYYGTHPAQLGNLPHGSVAAAISSPPYADGCGQQGHDYHPERMGGTRTGYIQRDAASYGTQLGQLGALPTGAVEAVVSSPLYMGRSQADGGKRGTEESPGMIDLRNAYGDTPGQLCQLDTNTTFWEAAKAIVAQVFVLLKPGGHAIWVVKNYIRAGKVVHFSQDWKRLCESLGFITLHEHHALLVEEHGTQAGLFGAETDTTYVTAKKSFFRRLAEKNGSPAIDWETVYCMGKPGNTTTGRLHACISSPPFLDARSATTASIRGNTPTRHDPEAWGITPGQLGTMPPGRIP